MSEKKAWVTLERHLVAPGERVDSFTCAEVDPDDDSVHFYMPNIDGVNELVTRPENVRGIVYEVGGDA